MESEFILLLDILHNLIIKQYFKGNSFPRLKKVFAQILFTFRLIKDDTFEEIYLSFQIEILKNFFLYR
jgi:hypothetical protein